MKAMILAAGLGTRLRPLTDKRPKALVEVAGRTLLDITLARLRGAGIREVIINVHHFAEMISDYLRSHNNFGMDIALSHEEELLDTGGGLKKAAPYFLENSRATEEPFLVHNVDVISNLDIPCMVQFHNAHHALATLAVKDRETVRYLLFDKRQQLCGRQSGRGKSPESGGSSSAVRALAFSGIHVISPQMLTMMTEEGAFSIIDAYLRMASQGQKILGFRADEFYWRDLGRPADVLQATQDLNSAAVQL